MLGDARDILNEAKLNYIPSIKMRIEEPYIWSTSCIVFYQ